MDDAELEQKPKADYNLEELKRLWRLDYEALALAPGQPGARLREARFVVQAKAALEAQSLSQDTRSLANATETMATATQRMAKATIGLALMTLALAVITAFDVVIK